MKSVKCFELFTLSQLWTGYAICELFTLYEYDLLDIEYYIFVDLCNPQAAQRISDGILDAAEKLSEYPTAHPLIDDELLRSVGLRMTHFDSYNIFYYYDLQSDVVYIIRVLYNKVDWQSLLKK